MADPRVVPSQSTQDLLEEMRRREEARRLAAAQAEAARQAAEARRLEADDQGVYADNDADGSFTEGTDARLRSEELQADLDGDGVNDRRLYLDHDQSGTYTAGDEQVGYDFSGDGFENREVSSSEQYGVVVGGAPDLVTFNEGMAPNDYTAEAASDAGVVITEVLDAPINGASTADATSVVVSGPPPSWSEEGVTLTASESGVMALAENHPGGTWYMTANRYGDASFSYQLPGTEENRQALQSSGEWYGVRSSGDLYRETVWGEDGQDGSVADVQAGGANSGEIEDGTTNQSIMTATQEEVAGAYPDGAQQGEWVSNEDGSTTGTFLVPNEHGEQVDTVTIDVNGRAATESRVTMALPDGTTAAEWELNVSAEVAQGRTVIVEGEVTDVAITGAEAVEGGFRFTGVFASPYAPATFEPGGLAAFAGGIVDEGADAAAVDAAVAEQVAVEAEPALANASLAAAAQGALSDVLPDVPVEVTVLPSLGGQSVVVQVDASNATVGAMDFEQLTEQVTAAVVAEAQAQGVELDPETEVQVQWAYPPAVEREVEQVEVAVEQSVSALGTEEEPFVGNVVAEPVSVEMPASPDAQVDDTLDVPRPVVSTEVTIVTQDDVSDSERITLEATAEAQPGVVNAMVMSGVEFLESILPTLAQNPLIRAVSTQWSAPSEGEEQIEGGEIGVETGSTTFTNPAQVQRALEGGELAAAASDVISDEAEFEYGFIDHTGEFVTLSDAAMTTIVDLPPPNSTPVQGWTFAEPGNELSEDIVDQPYLVYSTGDSRRAAAVNTETGEVTNFVEGDDGVWVRAEEAGQVDAPPAWGPMGGASYQSIEPGEAAGWMKNSLLAGRPVFAEGAGVLEGQFTVPASELDPANPPPSVEYPEGTQWELTQQPANAVEAGEPPPANYTLVVTPPNGVPDVYQLTEDQAWQFMANHWPTETQVGLPFQQEALDQGSAGTASGTVLTPIAETDADYQALQTAAEEIAEDVTYEITHNSMTLDGTDVSVNVTMFRNDAGEVVPVVDVTWPSSAGEHYPEASSSDTRSFVQYWVNDVLSYYGDELDPSAAVVNFHLPAPVEATRNATQTALQQAAEDVVPEGTALYVAPIANHHYSVNGEGEFGANSWNARVLVVEGDEDYRFDLEQELYEFGVDGLGSTVYVEVQDAATYVYGQALEAGLPFDTRVGGVELGPQGIVQVTVTFPGGTDEAQARQTVYDALVADGLVSPGFTVDDVVVQPR